MKKKKGLLILFLFLILIVCGLIVFPVIRPLSDWLKNKKIDFKLGLDLKGGIQLIYEADTSKIPEGEIDRAMNSLHAAIERRVNLFGVSEPVIQISKGQDGKWRLFVSLPGVKDFDQALQVIGKTAHLDFREEKNNTFVPTGLEGKHLKKAEVGTNPQTGEIVVNLEFNAEGAQLFAEITKRNVGKYLAIYLDDDPISIPRVNEEIKEGKAIISGNFDLASARVLATQLNAGALPVPIHLASQTNVEASLGEKYLKISLIGAAIGIFLVALFMVFYYRWAGLVADIVLAMYTIFILAIFKLSSLTPWPIVLTLSGIAGFVLSAAMAIDGNVLIFERMKEELKEGQTLMGALAAGFKRAWSSIRDAYTSSLISCLILYWAGTGLVRGFALTLALGLLVSMFTTVYLTKIFMEFLIQKNIFKDASIFGIKSVKKGE